MYSCKELDLINLMRLNQALSPDYWRIISLFLEDHDFHQLTQLNRDFHYVDFNFFPHQQGKKIAKKYFSNALIPSKALMTYLQPIEKLKPRSREDVLDCVSRIFFPVILAILLPNLLVASTAASVGFFKGVYSQKKLKRAVKKLNTKVLPKK